jgi:hypothetical protein
VRAHSSQEHIETYRLNEIEATQTNGGHQSQKFNKPSERPVEAKEDIHMSQFLRDMSTLQRLKYFESNGDIREEMLT